MLPPTERHIVNAVVALLQETDLPVRRIADKVGLHKSSVTRIAKRELGEKFYHERVLRLTPSGKHLDGGYYRITAPNWWEGSRSSRGVCAFEHQIVYCEANGLTRLPEGCCIHHINHDKLDNRLENLRLMTNSEHMRHHNLHR